MQAFIQFILRIAMLAMIAAVGSTTALPADEIGAQPASAPAAPAGDPREVVAEVLGDPIRRFEIEPPSGFETQRQELIRAGRADEAISADEYRSKALTARIGPTLIMEYYDDNKLAPTEQEIAEFLTHYHQYVDRMKKEGAATPVELLRQQVADCEKMAADQQTAEDVREAATKLLPQLKAELAQLEAGENDPAVRRANDEPFAYWYLQSWKVQKALFDTYGGRVYLMPNGPHASDAMRMFLEDYEKRGKFQIRDETLRKAFWEPFYLAPDGAEMGDPKAVFATSWALADKNGLLAPANPNAIPTLRELRPEPERPEDPTTPGPTTPIPYAPGNGPTAPGKP